jgi:hypothetical protein
VLDGPELGAASQTGRNATCSFAAVRGDGDVESAPDLVRGERSREVRYRCLATRITVGGKVANLSVQRPERAATSILDAISERIDLCKSSKH